MTSWNFLGMEVLVSTIVALFLYLASRDGDTAWLKWVVSAIRTGAIPRVPGLGGQSGLCL